MSRDRVYQALAERQGEFLSGQELSRRLGVSRAAVWKAVAALRSRGCEIEARSGLGYRLAATPDLLDRQTVEACLTAPRDNWQVLAQVDSTNTACRRLAADGAPDGTVVMADCQTAGKGRRGRSFLSPAGQGLYLSILWRPDCAPELLLPLTALSAVAVCRAVKRLSGVSPAIKWPNDLVLKGRKLCGILTEMSLEGESGRVDHVIVGIGVNCRQRAEDFPPELADIAASLDMVLPAPVRRAALAAALLEELDELRRGVLFAPERWLESYRARCLTVGSRVQVLRGDVHAEAEALAVDDRFGLTVRYDDGTTETLRSGEVSVRGLYGYV
ncbi:MAG: biotin--[acetyl-CoA-carboxylase] ligase [Ruminococcaceae bacterium]|jgi:BirA family biotin operon repressor/biotin-[acetyl-CoA-carboxylase] ligase|nr:biotin--[acetyl-CoA-carboxylase] ligase [Oscillospiraceae bacterium]